MNYDFTSNRVLHPHVKNKFSNKTIVKAIKSKIKFVSDKCESYFNFRGNIVVLIKTDLTVYSKQYIRAVSFRFLFIFKLLKKCNVYERYHSSSIFCLVLYKTREILHHQIKSI